MRCPFPVHSLSTGVGRDSVQVAGNIATSIGKEASGVVGDLAAKAASAAVASAVQARPARPSVRPRAACPATSCLRAAPVRDGWLYAWQEGKAAAQGALEDKHADFVARAAAVARAEPPLALCAETQAAAAVLRPLWAQLAAALPDAAERRRVACAKWIAALEGEVAPNPPPSRTKWTRRVLHPVLIGHAASFTP